MEVEPVQYTDGLDRGVREQKSKVIPKLLAKSTRRDLQLLRQNRESGFFRVHYEFVYKFQGGDGFKYAVNSFFFHFFLKKELKCS